MPGDKGKPLKLTVKQRELLAELENGVWVECSPSEKRTAESLQRKGLIEMSEQSYLGNFEIRAAGRKP